MTTYIYPRFQFASGRYFSLDEKNEDLKSLGCLIDEVLPGVVLLLQGIEQDLNVISEAALTTEQLELLGSTISAFIPIDNTLEV